MARGVVLACSILFGCQRAEPRAEADPEQKPVTAVSAKKDEIGEKELLRHLFGLYSEVFMDKSAHIPLPSDRWAGTKVRLVGWVQSSGPNPEGKPVAILKDKPSGDRYLWCLFDDGTKDLPKVGETVTVEGDYSVSGQWLWQLPIAQWQLSFSLRHCRVVPSSSP